MKFPYDLVWATLMLLPAASCATPGAPNNPTSTDITTSSAPSLAQGVTGVVRDETGKAIEGAMIVPSPRDPSAPPIPEIAILSSSDGRYQWPLRPGRYQLTVRAEGYGEAIREVTVGANSVATLDFVLSR